MKWDGEDFRVMYSELSIARDEDNRRKDARIRNQRREIRRLNQALRQRAYMIPKYVDLKNELAAVKAENERLKAHLADANATLTKTEADIYVDGVAAHRFEL